MHFNLCNFRIKEKRRRSLQPEDDWTERIGVKSLERGTIFKTKGAKVCERMNEVQPKTFQRSRSILFADYKTNRGKSTNNNR